MLNRCSFFLPLAFSAALIAVLAAILNAFIDFPQPVVAQEDGTAVSDVTVLSSTRSPAAVARYEVTFTTGAGSELAPLTDLISMELHEDIRVPRGISPATVRVNYRKDGDTKRGIARHVDLVDHTNPLQPTVIHISPAVMDGRTPVPIPGGAEVTVTFTQNAGIRNPTEGGAYSWKVWTGKDTKPAAASYMDINVAGAFEKAGTENADEGLLVDREIQLSHERTGRDQRISVIARGYKNGTTLTVWRDADVDGQQDPDESKLCDTTVLGNDIGYCNFTLTVPPFTAGTGVCDDDRVNGDTEKSCNLINARDGYGGTSVIYSEDNKINELVQVLELTGRVRASNVQGPGGTIQVELTDFPQGEVTSVDIGGVLAETGRLRVGPSGRLFFSIDVPHGARLGHQSLRVEVTRDESYRGESTYSESVVVVITHPPTVVTIFPETVLPNQRVSLQGAGFEGDDDVTIREFRIDGEAVGAHRVNDGQGRVETSHDGKWSSSLDMPVSHATTVPGVHSLQVEDNLGRVGSVEFTILPREVAVTPVWGRPGTLVTVSGSGFPARNDNGSSVNILIHYEFNGGSTLTATQTDGLGGFSQEVQVPVNALTPSSNLVRVEFEDDHGGSVITTARHEVPAATVTLSPDSGPPGTLVTVKGAGFRQFARVGEMTIGNIDVSPGATLATDANGEFTSRFLAPGIGTGKHTFLVSVVGITVGGTFDIRESGLNPGSPTPISVALEGLSDNLEVVFHFNDDAKTWSFYEPGELDGELEEMIAGETYWIQVRETVEPILNSKPRQLTCVSGNCWSHIVW